MREGKGTEAKKRKETVTYIMIPYKEHQSVSQFPSMHINNC